jgi:hypothetical protein
MSPRDLALQALAYIPNGNVATLAAASTLQKDRIAKDITAALQTIYSLAPSIYRRRDGAIIAAPIKVSVTVANGTTALTCATALVDGSTIKIQGDPTMFNEVRIQGSTKYLRIPFNGISGTYDADVWGDSIPLDSAVDRVLGAVKINETYELDKRVNRMDTVTRTWPEPDYGRRLKSIPSNYSVAQPVAYWVEPVYFTDGTLSTNRAYLRMRIYPLPRANYSLAFDVRVKATRLVAGDLGSDSTDSTATLPIAADMVESILLPLFLKRWTSSPWFKDKEKAAAIAEDAKEALALLQQYRPQQESNRRIVAPL